MLREWTSVTVTSEAVIIHGILIFMHLQSKTKKTIFSRFLKTIVVVLLTRRNIKSGNANSKQPLSKNQRKVPTTFSNCLYRG